jgi:CRISPR-associated protein Csm5
VHFAVNRKRAPVVDERGVLRKSQADNLYQILECISPGLYRGFAGNLTLQSLAALANQFTNRLPASDLRFDITQIARACNAFYRPILEDELHKMQARGFVDEAWVNGIQHLLHTSNARLERGEAFLLRVGRHSGAESVTLNGVRSIKIIRGKDSEGKMRTNQAANALTWWLAAQDKDQMQELLPFGWLFIEVVPDGQDAADWEPLQSLCATLAAPIRDLAQKLQAKESGLAGVRAEIETQR